VIELLAPTGDGPLMRELHRTGEGIRSAVFRVRNLEKARRYFTERGVELIAGTAPESFAVAPQANRGVLFEFAE
jgi:hypothetical protein